jgi:hypothetical protein
VRRGEARAFPIMLREHAPPPPTKNSFAFLPSRGRSSSSSSSFLISRSVAMRAILL